MHTGALVHYTGGVYPVMAGQQGGMTTEFQARGRRSGTVYRQVHCTVARGVDSELTTGSYTILWETLGAGFGATAGTRD